MLTQERLKELLHYNPDTGDFTWLERSDDKWNKNYAGNRVGSVDRSKLNCYMRTRINGNGTDNRWCNLRDVSNSVNCKNTVLRSSNRSGIHGVHFVASRQRWIVRISTGDDRLYLGSVSDFFEACCIRKSAELNLNYHSNHGRRCG